MNRRPARDVDADQACPRDVESEYSAVPGSFDADVEQTSVADEFAIRNVRFTGASIAAIVVMMRA
jgi:hypothetical protein